MPSPHERHLFCSACEPVACLLHESIVVLLHRVGVRNVGGVAKKMSWLFGNLGNFVILCYKIGEGVEDHAWFLRVGLRSRKIC